MVSKAWILGGFLMLHPVGPPVHQPPSEILGIRLGMSEEDAHRRLVRVGKPSTAEVESDLDQVWTLRDRRYGSLLLHLDRDGRVEWLTAYARPGARSLRYCDVADTSLAHHAGFHIYTWTVPPQGSRPGYVLTARGNDPAFLSTLSLSPLPPPPTK